MLTHCRNGHEYTLENTYVDKKNARSCRICRKKRSDAQHRTAYHKQVVRDWKKANPERVKSAHGKGWRHYHLLGRYGIDEKQYDELLLKQRGVCAICKKPPLPNKFLVVDHDHLQ